MAKVSFGQAKTQSAILEAKRHSNVGGELAEGRIFLHVITGRRGKKHMARYQKTEQGKYFCGTCGHAIE